MWFLCRFSLQGGRELEVGGYGLTDWVFFVVGFLISLELASSSVSPPGCQDSRSLPSQSIILGEKKAARPKNRRVGVGDGVMSQPPPTLLP